MPLFPFYQNPLYINIAYKLTRIADHHPIADYTIDRLLTANFITVICWNYLLQLSECCDAKLTQLFNKLREAGRRFRTNKELLTLCPIQHKCLQAQRIYFYIELTLRGGTRYFASIGVNVF